MGIHIVAAAALLRCKHQEHDGGGGRREGVRAAPAGQPHGGGLREHLSECVHPPLCSSVRSHWLQSRRRGPDQLCTQTEKQGMRTPAGRAKRLPRRPPRRLTSGWLPCGQRWTKARLPGLRGARP